MLIFGFFHGFGLATKLQEFASRPTGCAEPPRLQRRRRDRASSWRSPLILIAMGFWRRTPSFSRHAYTANVVLMTAGFVLVGYQLTGLAVS